jgi:hypothetical protein
MKNLPDKETEYWRIIEGDKEKYVMKEKGKKKE